MYNSYINFLENEKNVINNFKSNKIYCDILEHVSENHGFSYLKLICSEFNNISFDNIKEFCAINDKYGNPKMFIYNYQDNVLMCSPTSLRYIYHSLLILEHYKNTSCENIVEVGCGYGGLCLAINYFSNVLNIKINKYNLVDLSNPCILIEEYLKLNKNNIYTEIRIHDSSTYGGNINDTKLFFISNYCYTEISKEHNKQYTNILLPKTKSGFITWQNGGNKGVYPVDNSSKIINKKIIKIIEEKPQTDAGYGIYMNYFVYF